MSLFDDLPSACTEGATGGFPLDYSEGKLVFTDLSSYTIPNRAVRLSEWGAFEILVQQVIGDDVETVSGAVARRRVERWRDARIGLQFNYLFAANGTGYGSTAEGFTKNWLALQGLCETSNVGGDPSGLTTVEYTPYTGATPIELSVHVMPPILGSPIKGKGANAGMVIRIFNPSDITV